MKNNELYQSKIRVLCGSGVGVIYTRTREPFRAIEALQEYAFTKDLPFNLWNIRDGWITRLPSDDPDSTPSKEEILDPFSAMKWILGVGGGAAKDKGIFVMHALHPWLNKQQHPGIIECLRHYVRDMSELPRVRLIIVNPETENLPEELSHDIPIQDFDLPNSDERRDILQYVIESSTPPNEEVPKMFTDSEYDQLVAGSGGMTQMECEVSYSKAIVENKPEEGDWHNISFDSYNGTVLNQKTEVVKQSDILELMSPVDISEVGGLDRIKQWAEIAKDAFTEEAKAAGVDTPKGISAIGPPGTGKTLFGKAVANIFGMPLIRFDISRVFGSLVGQSEGNTRSAVNQIKAMAPCVVLVDEVDKGLGGAHNSSGDSGVSKRVLQILLTEMQEATEDIFWMFTANRHEGLDPALLRKGRMDEVFAVLPPNREEREAVLRIHLKKRKCDPENIKDLNFAIDASKGFVSAELEAAVSEAKKHSFHTKVKMSGALIADMLGQMKPISVAFADDFNGMLTWAEHNAQPASSTLEEEANPKSIEKAKRPRRRSVATK